LTRPWILRLLLFVSVLGAATGIAAERPNVVLVVSDDHGWGDVGWNAARDAASPGPRTPVLDQLAAEGVRLDRFYANPICSVTRAALMTGYATLRTGVNNRRGLELQYRLMPQAFRDAGYQTWMCGKWHLGGSPDNQLNGPEYLPHARGFDYFYGHLHGAIDYYTHQRKDLGQLDWQRNGQPVVEDGFTTDLLVRDAERLVRKRDRDRPFFLYLAFNAIHGPLQPPPGETDVSRRDRRALLLSNLAALDAALGRLLKTLQDEGIERNTLVVFHGDNGGQLNQGASNGTLRDEKGSTFEGGVRVPAAVRWPGVLPANCVSTQFVSVMDLFPTLCAAAGIETGVRGSLDGVNLWEALKGGREVEQPPMVLGNRDVACVAPPWKLVLPGRGETPLLFDIVADPNERQDVAAAHPEVVERLQRAVQSTGRMGGGGRGGAGGGDAGRRGRGGRRGGGRGGSLRSGDDRGSEGREDAGQDASPTKEDRDRFDERGPAPGKGVRGGN